MFGLHLGSTQTADAEAAAEAEEKPALWRRLKPDWTSIAVIVVSFILLLTSVRLDVGGGVNWIVDGIVAVFGPTLRAISNVIEFLFEATVDALLFVPEPVLIAVLGLLMWRLANGRIAALTVGALTLTAMVNTSASLGLWEPTIDTVVLVLLSTAFSLGVAVPLGIIMGLSDKFEMVMRPILDLMQTMPAFVYLIPAVMFLGVGKVPAIFATMIFAMPPPIRLTSLGVREVSRDMVEAATAFGATERQTLFDIQIPLAIPTIMAGVTQCIMLALSMAVIAAMIGAAGLGGEVLRGITTLNTGHGFEAGLIIVLLAIILDRTAGVIRSRSSGEQWKTETEL